MSALKLTTTIYARSAKALTSRISELYKGIPPDSSLLFSIGLSTDPSYGGNTDGLENLVSDLTSLNNSIGCISATPASHRRVSCSLAVFDATSVKPFRSTIPGPRPVQVGRWHAFRDREIEHPDTELQTTSGYAPAASKNDLLTSLEGIDKTDVSSLLYFSDLAPQGLSTKLYENFPNASQLGLLASSTPFITGRPVTLFENNSVHSSGAVGLALLSALNNSRQLQLSFDSLLPLPVPDVHESSPLVVKASEGNMIISLSTDPQSKPLNPTALLLSSLRAMGADMSALGEFTGESAVFALGVLDDRSDQMKKVHGITAGDPARGPISLDEHCMAPGPGERVKFFYLPQTSLSQKQKPSPRTRIEFTALLEAQEQGAVEAENETVIEVPHFMASSENGFVMTNAGETPWRCTVPGLAGGLI